MSLVTQLAPPNRAGQAIGLWFAAAAIGNVIAGLLGLLWGRLPHHQYFALLALLSLVAAAVLLSRLRLLDAATDSRAVG
jgi:POT family proton-dependent oligopeptide transporter